MLRSVITVWNSLTRDSSILSKDSGSAIHESPWMLCETTYTPSTEIGVTLMPFPPRFPRPNMQTRPIRFFHHRQGAVVEVSDVVPTRTVLNWLREDAHCSGTKEGCNEGDCGACTVIVAELAERAMSVGTPSAAATVVGGLSLRTVNACIQFVPTLDGKALLTVEDLKRIGGGALHPAQQALVECHGSQCGFCTPGIAMTLAGTYERHCE